MVPGSLSFLTAGFRLSARPSRPLPSQLESPPPSPPPDSWALGQEPRTRPLCSEPVWPGTAVQGLVPLSGWSRWT